MRSGSNRWEMGELKASYNRPVSESTQALVEQWLRDWSLSEVSLADGIPAKLEEYTD